MKRTSLEIKREILKTLSDGNPHSYAELERKVNTGYRSVVSNCEELRGFGAVKIAQLKEHSANGRPFFQVDITNLGRNFLKNN